MPTLQINGIDVHDDVVGEGKSLLLQAGVTCDHSVWLPAAFLLREVFGYGFDQIGEFIENGEPNAWQSGRSEQRRPSGNEPCVTPQRLWNDW